MFANFAADANIVIICLSQDKSYPKFGVTKKNIYVDYNNTAVYKKCHMHSRTNWKPVGTIASKTQTIWVESNVFEHRRYEVFEQE